jgi:hypothetical protein
VGGQYIEIYNGMVWTGSIWLRIGTLELPSGVLPSGFPTKILNEFLFTPICAKYPAHLILLDLIIIIMFGEEYKERLIELDFICHTPIR